jgi:Trm5-related predicted tRNA methylase
MTDKEKKKILANMNTDDFNTMRSMLSDIELKIMPLDPIHQKQFYLPLQNMILAAWEEANSQNFTFKNG